MLSSTLLAAVVSACPLAVPCTGAGGGYTYTYDLSREVIDLTLGAGAIDLTDPLPAGPVETFGSCTEGRVSLVRSGLVPGEPIVVRTREDIPLIVFDPSRPIDDVVDELERQRPWVRRTDDIRDDLLEARRRYLKRTGQILSVQTFEGHDSRRHEDGRDGVGDRVIYVGDPGALPGAPRAGGGPEPIVRAHKPSSEAPTPELKEGSVIRVRTGAGD